MGVRGTCACSHNYCTQNLLDQHSVIHDSLRRVSVAGLETDSATDHPSTYSKGSQWPTINWRTPWVPVPKQLKPHWLEKNVIQMYL